MYRSSIREKEKMGVRKTKNRVTKPPQWGEQQGDLGDHLVRPELDPGMAGDQP